LRVFVLVGTAAIALAAGSPALARQAGTAAQNSRTTSYDAAFFSQFAPRTALDIVDHVPGFQLDLGSTQSANGSVDVRGFAGTAGNVVINGARPSTKSETLNTTLQRIPAQRVVRVEVGPGDLYGSDYSGKSQVLNVILSDAAGFDANVTANATRRYDGYIQPNLSANALIRKGPSSLNLSAGTQRNKQFEEGTDTFVDVPTGELLEFRRKHNVYYNRDPFLSAAYALEHGSDDAYRINARWQPSRFDLYQRNRVTPSGGDPHDDNTATRCSRLAATSRARSPTERSSSSLWSHAGSATTSISTSSAMGSSKTMRLSTAGSSSSSTPVATKPSDARAGLAPTCSASPSRLAPRPRSTRSTITAAFPRSTTTAIACPFPFRSPMRW
jgi:hypothetical protein